MAQQESDHSYFHGEALHNDKHCGDVYPCSDVAQHDDKHDSDDSHFRDEALHNDKHDSDDSDGPLLGGGPALWVDGPPSNPGT